MSEKVKVHPISGFPEWLPNLRLAEQRLIGTIRSQYELFGFAPIETPAVERLDVLAAKGGMQRQIYSIGRPEADGEDTAVALGLHFDLTVPLARYVVQHAADLVFPFRRYQIQKVWRGERAQRGRYREFTQCDVDIIGRGSLDVIHDAEMPVIINATFQALGLPDFQVHMSNRKILGQLLAAKAVPEDRTAAVLRVIDKSLKGETEQTRRSLGDEGLDDDVIPLILDLNKCETVAEARKILDRAGANPVGLDELQVVIETATSLGMPESRIRPNFAIARGLDYYTGTIYETFVRGKEDWGSVCSGGRYDDLASYFTDQKYPGVGISVGLSRLFSLLVDSGLLGAKSQTPTKVLVTMQDRKTYLRDYLGITRTLREGGIPSEAYLDPGSLRDQIGFASAKGIRYALIAGGTEFANDTVMVKDLDLRTQVTVARGELVSYITAGLSRD